MAMVVNNNMPALNTLNQVNRNSSDLAKQLKKVASGMKINSAGDDASGYGISERMQVQIRGLDECDINTETGNNMIDVALGAVNEQVQIMKQLRAIAMKASDDTYTDKDREVLQSECTHLLMESNNISYDTNYNGIPLLRGVVPGTRVTYFDYSGGMKDNTVDYVIDPNNASLHYPVSSQTSPSYNGYGTTLYRYLNSTVYNPNIYTPVVFTFPTSPGSVVYDSSGTAYSAVSNNGILSVYNGSSYVPIVDNNGNNSTGNPATGATFTPMQYSPTLPTAGMTVATSPTPGSATYLVGQEDFSSNLILYGAGTLSSYKLDFSSVSGLPPASTALDGQGFSIMCNGCDQFVSIRFDASMSSGTGKHWVDETGNNSEAYIIGIGGANTSDDVAKALFEGVQDALKNHSDPVTVTSYHDVEIRSYTDASGNTSYYLTKNGPEFCLYNGFMGELVTVGGELPHTNFYIQGDTKSSFNTRLYMPNTTLNILFPSADSNWDIEPTEEDYPNPWPSDFRTLSDSDKNYYRQKYNCRNEDEIRRAKWRDEVWPYPRKGAVASASCVRTREKANKFVEDIDQAIKYLLDAGTTLGSLSQRTEMMNDNIVVSNENTQAAESVIRDADMAKEMVAYTKANVLTQASQSMLAQANQNASSVLSLLQ